MTIKKTWGKIFELNKEVIGFDSVEEAIDQTRYFLSHDNERIEIAIAGWKRALKDYNEIAVFKLAEKYINEVIFLKKPVRESEKIIISQRRKTFIKRATFYLKNKISKMVTEIIHDIFQM